MFRMYSTDPFPRKLSLTDIKSIEERKRDKEWSRWRDRGLSVLIESMGPNGSNGEGGSQCADPQLYFSKPLHFFWFITASSICPQQRRGRWEGPWTKLKEDINCREKETQMVELKEEAEGSQEMLLWQWVQRIGNRCYEQGLVESYLNLKGDNK